MGLPQIGRAERFLAGAFLVALPLVNPYLRGEGNGYYAYVASLVIDGDVRFENEYRRGDPDFVSSNFRRADGHLWPPLVMPSGFVRNQWDVGSSLLWAPAFLQAHLMVLLLREVGLEVGADGYSLPYRLVCALATAVYGFAGLLLAYRTARRLTGEAAAFIATAGLWFASSLPVYMYFLPFYSHATASFSVSLFLWYWLARRPLRAAGQWALWGLSAGLMFEVDHRAGVLVLLALLEWVRGVRGLPWRSLGRQAPLRHLAHGLAFAATALLAALPQLVVKWALHGSPLRMGGLQRFFWDSPQLWKVGFASEHGAFLWTPLLLLALVGLIVLTVRDRFVGGALMVAGGAFYYVIASYESWHAASSFGNRFFIPLTPIFVLGLAHFLREAHRRLARRMSGGMAWATLAVPLTLLTLWNAGLMFQWGTGMIPRQGPVDFSLVASQQVNAVPNRIFAFGRRYLRERQEVTSGKTQ